MRSDGEDVESQALARVLFIGKYIRIIFLEDDCALAPSGEFWRSQGCPDVQGGRSVGRQGRCVVQPSGSGTSQQGVRFHHSNFLAVPEQQVLSYLGRTWKWR